MKPEWADRLERLLAACDRLGAGLAAPRLRGIHRDFYADHVLVDASRLYLLDFDLHCQGDPALDIGNFSGHMIEHSLRTRGVPDALAEPQRELEKQFLALSGDSTADAVSAYTTLALVRHIFLSTQFPERHHTTQALLELCEDHVAKV
jgi:aminoglycoside phosphotransferase (APT) family kinase protein